MDKQKSLSRGSLAKTSSWRRCNQGLITRLMLTPFRKDKNTPSSRLSQTGRLTTGQVLLNPLKYQE
tara:strand:- start:18779 stop:18976 length:198 start_codon:yes stop_codon:yes gene_type:complete